MNEYAAKAIASVGVGIAVAVVGYATQSLLSLVGLAVIAVIFIFD